MKGVLELAESTQMGKDDWNVQVSNFNFNIIYCLLLFIIFFLNLSNNFINLFFRKHQE